MATLALSSLLLVMEALAQQSATPAPAPLVPAAQQVPAPAPVAPSITAAPISPQSPSTDGSGEVVVTGRHLGQTPGDPLEATNLKVFEFTQSVDRGVVEPVAKGYKHALPSPVRGGLRHVLRNLDEPVNFLHFMLQLKPGRAAATVGRVGINSTIGVAGLIDVAKNKPFNLPYRDNGLANTLGYYGVRPGTYFYLPLVGPTTTRDLVGLVGDTFTLPLTIGKPFNYLAYSIPATTLRALDDRVEYDDQLRKLRRDNPSPYTASRDFYLAERQKQINALHSRKWQVAHAMP